MNNNCEHKDVYRIKPLHSDEELYYFCDECQKIVPVNCISADAVYCDCTEDERSKYLKALSEGKIEIPKKKIKFWHKLSNKYNKFKK